VDIEWDNCEITHEILDTNYCRFIQPVRSIKNLLEIEVDK